MATELGENVQVKANLAFMAKVIAIVGTCVWGYSVVWNKLMVLDSSLDRVQHEGTLLGDLSARMMHLEKFAEQSKYCLQKVFCQSLRDTLYLHFYIVDQIEHELILAYF